jgi:hypothetical protein
MGRSRRNCPVPGCSARDLLRVPNHLAQVHGYASSERQTWLNPSADTMFKRVESAVSWSPNDVKGTDRWWSKKSLLPFRPCSSISISGMSGSGKTTFVYRFLRNLEGMYTDDPPRHVLYYYMIYQRLYDDMERALPNFTLHEGPPSEEELDDYTRDRDHRLVILDDLYQEVLHNPRMEKLFTQGCHHRRISVLFLSQNLFSQGKSARTIALNTWYQILFQNVRDASQVAVLARQIFPGRSRVLIDAYRDVMKEPYAYLVVDTSPGSDDKYRLRTRVFPGEDPLVYVPKSS